ncbi:MAG: hypothetical protein AVDCRST_MAG93-7522, partial [uncultured Chloroflexia bacterium]
QARKVLDEMKALRSIAQNLRGEEDTRLRFAACVTVGERLLPEWLWQFKNRTPNAVPMVFMGNDPAVLAVIKSGEMPIGIVAGDYACEDFESTTILEDELVVVVAPDHPWAQRRVGPEDLSGGSFIAREHGSALRTVVEQTLKDIGDISLNVQMELGSNTAVKEAIESGAGFSILSRADVKRKLEAGKLVQVEGLSVPWSFKLLRHPTASLSSIENDFYEFILSMCNQEDTEPVKPLVGSLRG